MSKMRYTAGPWSLTLTGDIIGKAENGQPHHITRCEAIQSKADLRLIAAAPELIETLEAIAKELDRDAFRLINSSRPGDQSVGNTLSWAIAMCENAIAKATGGKE